jgi:excisionase family DNA binding protein
MAAIAPDYRFLLAEEVAQRLRCSLRTVHELTRTGRIPHVKLDGSRRCLFRDDELKRWEDGAPLETRRLGASGRIVHTT